VDDFWATPKKPISLAPFVAAPKKLAVDSPWVAGFFLGFNQ
jgi:hypothetical protein